MTQELEKTCALFISNIETFRRNFAWDGEAFHVLASAVLTSYGIEADREQLKSCEAVLKERTGIMSPLRGHLRLPTLCEMAVSDDASEYLDNVDRAFKLMKKDRFTAGARKYFASVVLASEAAVKDDLLILTDSTATIYSSMSFAGSDDTAGYGFMTAAGIAAEHYRDKKERNDHSWTLNSLIKDAKDYAALLEKKFGASPQAELLAYVLSSGRGSTMDKCRKLIDIADAISGGNAEFPSGDALPAAGPLALIDMDAEAIAAEYEEAATYLKSAKKNVFNKSACSQPMYTALMLEAAYSEDRAGLRAAESAVLENAMTASLYVY